ncbi:hypothetical protein AB0D32_30965 [Micromonospora sp. NPDC048170]|uniref:hypothetical protein n=1 Tax=Micromonospora sp. NPDC048170 TaxID=3154819 RepID=UPI0033F80E98
MSVEIDGMHRSYVCLLTDGSHSSTLFVPGVPGATVGAEEQLARLVSGAGLPPTRAVVRHPWQAPPADELRHSIPADGVTVVRRSAASHALLTEGEGDPETRPLSADPSSTEFVGAVPVDDDRLREVLAGLVEPSTSVPMGEYVTVDEGGSRRTASRTAASANVCHG